MINENEPILITKPLPEIEADRMELLVDGYGLAAIAQCLRNICAQHAGKYGPDATRLTIHERRETRLWGFMRNDTEAWLSKILDHGPQSGCK